MKTEELVWAQEIEKKILDKYKVTVERNQHNLPYTTVDGRYDDWTDTNPCWWTHGFWGGILWQLYSASKEESYKKVACDLEERMDKNLITAWGLDHDNGFKWLPTSVANYRLHNNEESKNRGLLAANNLAGRFNLAGKFIRAWNDKGDGATAGWAIIDCMMNLPLLYWASDITSDPRFNQIAIAHADTAMKYFIREDGSSNHICSFNPETGEYIETFGGQGYEVGSSWTRGQGWALYGFTLSYMHTKKQEYLDTAIKVADYFTSCIPESGLIPVDFRQPAEPAYEDSTAAAIAACGLLELEKLVEGELKEKYHNAAIKMLKALVDNRCNWSTDTDNIVEKCTAAYHDNKHEFAIIYGDYYFIEAILKLTGKELFIW